MHHSRLLLIARDEPNVTEGIPLFKDHPEVEPVHRGSPDNMVATETPEIATAPQGVRDIHPTYWSKPCRRLGSRSFLPSNSLTADV
jgi:hypothetical protein